MDQRCRMDLWVSLAILVMSAVAAGCTPKLGSQPPANPVSPSAVAQPIAQPEPTQPAILPSQPSPSETKPPLDEPYPSFALRTISPGHWQIGPLGEQLTASFEWFNEHTLLFSPGHPYGSIIDLQQGRIVDPSPIPVPRMTISPYTAFSPDMRHVAYIRQGDLVIREIGSGLEKIWKTGASPDGYSRHLWWSPNGRYIVGSWRIFSGQPNTGKVWFLDWQTGEITRLFDEPNSLDYFDGQWSPDGKQIVLRGAPPKGSFTHEYILADLPSGTVKVVVPRNNQMYVERQFVWDDKGQLQVKNIMNGPDESRPVTYDRQRKQYDDMAGEDRIRGTELHFLTYERDVVLTIDLEPALKAAGIPLDETALGHIAATMSPNGQWVLLTGYLGQNEDTTVAFCGSVEVDTRTVKIIRGNTRGGWGIKPTWSENKVLVSGQQQLAEYDLRTSTLTPLVTGQEVYAAYRSARGILYVGSQDIGIIRPDGSCDLVIQAGADEIFGMYQRLSPSGRYLVANRRNRGDGLYRETVDIVDLEQYGW